MHAHEMPAAMQLGPLEPEIEMALLVAALRIAFRLPGAAVPDHHGPAAVFTLGNRALEFVVFDRVILHMHREPLLAGNEARAAGHRPALHHAVKFKPQIVMQPGRGMLLNDESIAPAFSGLAARLRRDPEAAFGPVGLKCHWSVS